MQISSMHHRVAFAGAAIVDEVELHVGSQRALNAEFPDEFCYGCSSFSLTAIMVSWGKSASNRFNASFS